MADAPVFVMPNAPAEIQAAAKKLREVKIGLEAVKASVDKIKEQEAELNDQIYDWLGTVRAPEGVPITVGLGVSAAIGLSTRTESLNEAVLLRAVEVYWKANRLPGDAKQHAEALTNSVYDSRKVTTTQTFKFIDAEAQARAMLRRKQAAAKRKASGAATKKTAAKKARTSAAAAAADDDEDDDSGDE